MVVKTLGQKSAVSSKSIRYLKRLSMTESSAIIALPRRSTLVWTFCQKTCLSNSQRSQMRISSSVSSSKLSLASDSQTVPFSVQSHSLLLWVFRWSRTFLRIRNVVRKTQPRIRKMWWRHPAAKIPYRLCALSNSKSAALSKSKKTRLSLPTWFSWRALYLRVSASLKPRILMARQTSNRSKLMKKLKLQSKARLMQNLLNG